MNRWVWCTRRVRSKPRRHSIRVTAPGERSAAPAPRPRFVVHPEAHRHRHLGILQSGIDVVGHHDGGVGVGGGLLEGPVGVSQVQQDATEERGVVAPEVGRDVVDVPVDDPGQGAKGSMLVPPGVVHPRDVAHQLGLGRQRDGVTDRRQLLECGVVTDLETRHLRALASIQKVEVAAGRSELEHARPLTGTLPR